jgi:coenzyme F420 hydrogenase subunit beta
MSEELVMGRRYEKNRFTIEEVRAFWDSVADEYVHDGRTMAETHFQRFERAFAHFRPNRRMRALNIWSRNGEAIDYFRCRAPDIELVNAEVSPRLIEKARARHPAEAFVNTDLGSLPFADNEFDFVLSLETLEHAPDPLGFLRELARVLRPGGRLVLSCPPATAELPLWLYERFLPNHGEGPHRFLSSREVKRLLQAAGLELKRHESTLFIPAGPHLLRRVEPLVERIAANTPLAELGIRQFFVCERPANARPWQQLMRHVVETNLCTRCGTCVGVCPAGVYEFRAKDEECLPKAVRSEACTQCGLCTSVCPGRRVLFSEVRDSAGDAPIKSKELGPIRRIRAAHAHDPTIRTCGASGGVATAILCDLLERGEINGALVLDAHPEAPWRPWPRIARTREEIAFASQSKYCVTPTCAALKHIDPQTDRLAIVALPCQIHALRALEHHSSPLMKAVRLIIGLYCGNQLYFGATRSFLKRHGVRDLAEVAEIRYRDGAWPGNVRCLLNSGRSFSVPKFQFNHLISFYAIERCLLCADLAAEGADISVGDAWDRHAAADGGWSLVLSRTSRGESIVGDLVLRGVIEAQDVDLDQALAMHAHAIDLKKTGALLRIQRLNKGTGPLVNGPVPLSPAPQYDLPEINPPLSRQLAEVFISGQFRLLHTRPARWIIDRVPFGLIGNMYVAARKVWRWAAARKYKVKKGTIEKGTGALAKGPVPFLPRRSWTHWLRLLGPVLLLIMLWRIGPENCWSVVSGADPWWFLAACALSVPALAIKALRWQEILRSLGFRSTFGESMSVYAMGSLAGAVTPGKVGDLAKAPLMVEHGIPLSSGIGASLFDRVLDGTVLLALGIAGLLALPVLPGRGFIAAAAACALGLTIATACVLRRVFASLLRLTSARWWAVMAATTGASLGLYYLSVYFCAEAVGISLSFLDIIAGASVAAVLALLPVTVAGIGTRDAVFAVVFAQHGVDAGHAVALSSLVLAWMLVNCIFFLVISRLRPKEAHRPPFLSNSVGGISHEPRDRTEE